MRGSNYFPNQDFLMPSLQATAKLKVGRRCILSVMALTFLIGLDDGR